MSDSLVLLSFLAQHPCVASWLPNVLLRDVDTLASFCCTSLQQQSRYMKHVMSDSLSNCLSSRNTLVLYHGFLMYCCVRLSCWLPSAAPRVSSNRSTWNMSCLTVWFQCPSSHNTLVLRHGFRMNCCVMLTRWLPSAAPCFSSNRSTWNMLCLTVCLTVSLLATPLCCIMTS